MAPNTAGAGLDAVIESRTKPGPTRDHHPGRVLALALVLVFLATLPLGPLAGARLVRTPTPADTTARTQTDDPHLAHQGAVTAGTEHIRAAKAPTSTVPKETVPVAETNPVATMQASVPTPNATTAATQPPVATLVDEVEVAGVEPGSSWSWSMGDTTTQCGAIESNAAGTGCTFGSVGAVRSVFAGSPSLALVAHELANAETENDAIPSLISDVTTAEAGTSWTPIDAVASCLVEHFMGFQDDAAGAWQCPVTLAAFVAENIHDAVTTTEVTARCGLTSGVTSTLTFTGSAGTLSVTAPEIASAPQSVPAGMPVAVSGIGTFVAVDDGGSISHTGECEP